METMDSIFDKLMQATDSARGNVMAFGDGNDRTRADDGDAPYITCPICLEQVEEYEFKVNDVFVLDVIVSSGAG